MSVTVDQLWTYRFHDAIWVAYQQMKSLLENIAMPGMVHRDTNSQVDFHERIGVVMANDVVNPFGPAVHLNPPHSRRAVRLISSDAAVLISDEHTLRSMANPQSPYTQLMVAALGRRADKHILDALLGTAETASVTSGSGTITFGTQALPSSRVIGGATAIDLARIVNAGELLSKQSVPYGPAERKFLYSPGQERDIMAITQASSSDFTKNQIHDRGTINGVTWQGFDWMLIPDVMQIDTTVLGRMLPLPSYRSCIAFHRGAFGLTINRPLGAPQIDPRPDLQSRPTQVRQALMMAAVRVAEGGVVRVDCLEN